MYAQIHSRHEYAVEYKTYIKYLANVDDETGIDEWYCTCPSGSRTVGCCVHITSIIYYLSCLKHFTEIPSPAGDLSTFFSKIEFETSGDESDEDNDIDDKNDSLKIKNYPDSEDELIDDIDIEDELNETTD